ncbi:LysR family transcriptional regulator [Pseudomonas sp. Marseille-Q5115]|uniref:LysR family transcriptional regulator n=1 Tax=Pseudomonas sp. Marseille-Q5115 TaxID=2866593 RepID=UPI001CE3C6B1|nr:LysR family transcriptional regulator [Pseudomonas sp. Marseille-Q5115]
MFSSERLKGIDVFVIVADLGSFTAAAERLNLTSSAVSKGIARLEARLGTRLFQRTTRRLSLTEAGEAFYRTCATVLADLEEAEVAMTSTQTEPQGKVRIDLPASYGRLHVLPLIIEFMKQHPRLSPHISFSDRYVDLVHENIDIVVRIGGAGAWPTAVGHRFFGTPKLIFCASPDYLTRHGHPESEADLDRHLCVGYGLNDGMAIPWYFKGRQQGDIERRIMHPHIAVGDGEGEVMAVLAGLGIAQLPLWLVHAHLETGRIVEVLPHLATQGQPMNLVWLKSREALPKVNALIAYLGANLTPTGRR